MKFIALGGTDYVGASCYYIELDGTKILLDCGKGICKNTSQMFSPAFSALLTTGCMSSLGQLDAILISHAHFDHIGALSEITSTAPDTPVFATSLTKELTDHLLFDRLVYWDSNDKLSNFRKRFAAAQAADRIQTVGYSKSFPIGNVTVTFFEAGHVPGAAAIYLQSNEKNVLYTGDYRLDATPLTAGLHLPAWVEPDTVILNGIHAKHPTYHPRDTLPSILKTVQMYAERKMPLYVQVSQLTKGVELLCLFQTHGIRAPIMADDNIYRLAERMSQLGIPVLSSNCERMPKLGLPNGICLGSRQNPYRLPQIKADFTLHSTLSDDITLLTNLHPQVVYLVHSPKNAFGSDYILQEHFPDMVIVQPIQESVYTM